MIGWICGAFGFAAGFVSCFMLERAAMFAMLKLLRDKRRECREWRDACGAWKTAAQARRGVRP